jgi:hypothetical protein
MLILLGAALVAVTIVIQAMITTSWLRHLARRQILQRCSKSKWVSMRVLSSTGIVLLAMHILQILVWATTYRWLVPEHDLRTYEEAAYFSFVTFTTLGYGDITLSETYRMLSGIQAMNGILLVGWSTAILFAIVQRIWAIKVSDESAS